MFLAMLAVSATESDSDSGADGKRTGNVHIQVLCTSENLGELLPCG